MSTAKGGHECQPALNRLQSAKAHWSNCYALASFWHKRDIAARREYKRHESGARTLLPANLGALPVGKRDAPKRCDVANGPVAGHIQVESGHQSRVSVMGWNLSHLRLIGHLGNFDTLFSVGQNISHLASLVIMIFCQNLNKKDNNITYSKANPFRINSAP
jgi:hypothetical protein